MFLQLHSICIKSRKQQHKSKIGSLQKILTITLTIVTFGPFKWCIIIYWYWIYNYKWPCSKARWTKPPHSTTWNVTQDEKNSNSTIRFQIQIALIFCKISMDKHISPNFKKGWVGGQILTAQKLGCHFYRTSGYRVPSFLDFVSKVI